MLRAGLIGLGNIAWRFDASELRSTLTHYSTYLDSTRVALVSGYDPSQLARKEFSEYSNIDTVESVEDFIALDLDVVSITSPTEFHASHLEQCLLAEVPMIWLEKPICCTLSDAEALYALQLKRGASKVLLGYQRRYLSVFQRLKSLLIEKSMGECLSITIHYSRGFETNGVHYVDLLFYLLGDVSQFDISTSINKAGDKNPSFFVNFHNGIMCSVIGVDVPYHSIDIGIQFEKGRHSVLYGGVSELSEIKVEHELYPGYFRLKPDESSTCNVNLLSTDIEAVFPRMLKDLISSHQMNCDPISNLRTGLLTQELVEKVRLGS